jgi:hypothetical protein
VNGRNVPRRSASAPPAAPWPACSQIMRRSSAHRSANARHQQAIGTHGSVCHRDQVV